MTAMHLSPLHSMRLSPRLSALLEQIYRNSTITRLTYRAEGLKHPFMTTFV